MKITFAPHPLPNHDHVSAYANGKLFGWRGLESGKIGLERCPSCGRENYAVAVLSGKCCWCGWQVHEHVITEDEQ